MLPALIPIRFFPAAGVAGQQRPGPAPTSHGGPPPTVYRFVLTSLPANTPHDASLYLVGSFNNWQPADARYRFRRQADGTYTVAVPLGAARAGVQSQPGQLGFH